MAKFKKGDVVTVRYDGLVSSNTFFINDIVGENAYLNHPLFPECSVKYKMSELNTVQANLKDSTEKCLDFAKINSKQIGYPLSAELDAICMFFVVKRKLTSKQKQIVATICGRIARIKLNDNIQEAMKLIKTNEALLDEFNGRWYRAFYKLFSGKQLISSKKQMDAIYNMAGFIMAELENPITAK